MMARVVERMVAGELEAGFVLVAVSSALFVLAAALWYGRRVRAAAQRRTTTRS